MLDPNQISSDSVPGRGDPRPGSPASTSGPETAPRTASSAASPEWAAPDGGSAAQVTQEEAAEAAARAQAKARARERLRYSWWLPRRMGAYLTGTAGRDRLGGLDAARGLALVGMMAVHTAYSTCGLTTLPGLLHQAQGRASILFAVIAGFSLGIMSGGRSPHGGQTLVTTRLRLLVRSALLLVAGALLTMLGTPVAVILGFYAAWLALAVPFLRWRPRNLFILAGVVALFGQAVVLALPPLLTSLGMSPYPLFADGNSAVTDFFLLGTYPGAVWMAFIFLGLGLSRLDWSRTRNLWRLVGVGVLCAVLGYAGGWAASEVNTAAYPDTYHLVSPADPQQCLPATMKLSSMDPALASAKDMGADTASANADTSGLTDSSTSSWSSTDLGGAAEAGVNDSTFGGIGDMAPFILPTLSTAAPHSGTPFEVLGSGGVAMAVIGLFQLVFRRFRYVLAPLAAIGSMSLTVYSAHVVTIWAAREVDYAADNAFFLSMTAGFIVFALTWFAVFARGPLEHVVHVVSMRSTRARD